MMRLAISFQGRLCVPALILVFLLAPGRSEAKPKKTGFTSEPRILIASESGARMKLYSVVDTGSGFVAAFGWAEAKGKDRKVYLMRVRPDGKPMGKPEPLMREDEGLELRLIWHKGRLLALALDEKGLVLREVGKGGGKGDERVLLTRQPGKTFPLLAHVWDGKAVAVLLRSELSKKNPMPAVTFARYTLEGKAVGKSHSAKIGPPLEFGKGWFNSMTARLAYTGQDYLATVSIASRYELVANDWDMESSTWVLPISAKGKPMKPWLAATGSKSCIVVLGEQECKNEKRKEKKGGPPGAVLAALQAAGPVLGAAGRKKGLALEHLGKKEVDSKAAGKVLKKIASKTSVDWSLESPAKQAIAKLDFAAFASPWEAAAGGMVLAPAGQATGIAWVLTSEAGPSKKKRWVMMFALLGAGSEKEPPAPAKPPTPKGPAKPEDTAKRCKDGVDNDKDGAADCDDEDCRVMVFCAGKAASKKEPENTAQKCKDGKDNDKDGYVDCKDQDCSALVFCE
jgi:hypothetical protein